MNLLDIHTMLKLENTGDMLILPIHFFLLKRTCFRSWICIWNVCTKM